MADSVTQLRAAGPVGTKRNLVILGDGFAAADQATYNNWIQTTLLGSSGAFGRDYFFEDASAWNIFRVNLESVDSGVSTRVYDEHGTPADGSDDTITSDTTRNTALGIIFSGSWAHCWLEYGTNSESRIKAALKKWVPDYNFVLIVLNTMGFGGCGGGGRAHVTLGSGWDVIAHEFGHGLGGLADEYCVDGAYSGSEPGAVDLTIDTNRATVKWGNFIAPSTPVPTGTGDCAGYNQGTKPATWDDNQDVGLFEGGGTRKTGIFRPAITCRMRSNSPPYCPVCYNSFKLQYDSYTGHHFLNCYAGDFNGDGRSDVLVHSDNSIQIFRSNGSQLDFVSSAVERVPGSWQFKPNDQFFVGDFNGDGKDEVAVFNGVDWVMPYLGLLVDDGNGGLRLIARYDGDIPGWGGFAANDKFYVGDFNGDGKKDLFVFNGRDWSMTYVAMLRSTGTGFAMVRRFDGDIPGWGGLARNDQLFVGDYSGNGRDDLYIFNGDDWSMSYVGMFRSTGTDLAMTARYDGDIPGWGGLARHDRADRRRLRRRPQGGSVHLQRRRLEHALSRDVPLDRLWPVDGPTATMATFQAGAASPGTTPSSPPTSPATARPICSPGTTRIGPRNILAGCSRPAPPCKRASPATGSASGTLAASIGSRPAISPAARASRTCSFTITIGSGSSVAIGSCACRSFIIAGSTTTATVATGEGEGDGREDAAYQARPGPRIHSGGQGPRGSKDR